MLSPREIVQVVQEDAPRFDRYLLSKCEHPEKYGIRLLNEIEHNLAEAFPPTAPEARKPDRTTNPCRLYCTVGKRLHVPLQRALQADGFKTTQDGLVYIISKYLEGHNGTEEETAHV